MIKTALKCLAAAALLGVGSALLVLPGPGIPFLIAGIALLATEFAWAANLQRGLVAFCKSLFRRGASAA